MKTIKFLFTVLAVAIVAVASAVEKPKMDVVPLTPDRAVVSILNNKEAMFELSIKAENGELVYYKQSAKPLNSYQKVFDFTELTDGKYTMNLKVNDTRLSKEFEVASNGISVGESKLRFDPYFAYADDVLKLSYLNFDQEHMSLNIYNENGLVYQSKLGKEFNMVNGYDLSALEKGKYEVVLSSSNNEYTYSLVK
ncbi:hypothetical protein [Maribellus sp. YY47]|uniref:hypothetical protein n=1 Tax=Maribellus sp. YY47 TaxID=2929486 RepID=UPI002001D80E|nr:hypothetical protein [Maribellus sp. YY47]MCK3683539.1 hypothetical protein [Maribellus sp. YY47]